MTIAIDFGNTSTKIGLFNGKNLTETHTFYDYQKILPFLELHKPEKVVLADVVGDKTEEIINSISNQYLTLKINSNVKLPIGINYQTPQTLGSDRLCAAVGANAVFKNIPVLNIDTGTCIKYNFINNNNEFVGGAISPGILMRYKALNYYTGKLPLLKPDFNYYNLIGKNTAESLHSGVLFATVAEVTQIIELYEQKFNNLKIIVSGGDTDFLAKHLKNTIFAHQNLVLIGLNEILLYNT